MIESIVTFIACGLVIFQEYRIYNLKQHIQDQVDLIMAMALELKELGSPNVQIFEKETPQ